MRGFSLENFKSFVKECSPEKVSNALKKANKSLAQYAKENGIEKLSDAGPRYVKEFGETAVGEVVDFKKEGKNNPVEEKTEEPEK